MVGFEYSRVRNEMVRVDRHYFTTLAGGGLKKNRTFAILQFGK